MKTELEKAIEAATDSYKAVIAAAKREAIQEFIARMAVSADMPTPKGRAVARTSAPKAPKAARRQAVASTTPGPSSDARPTPPEAKPKAPAAPKRSEEELAKLMKDVLTSLADVDGKNVESLARDVSAETSALRLPLKRLIEAGTVRTEGERRATKYFLTIGNASATPIGSYAAATNGAARRVVVDESHEQGAEA